MEINKVNCKTNCRTVLERNTVPHIASAGDPAPRSSFGPGVTISTVCSQPSHDQIKDAASFKCLNNSFIFLKPELASTSHNPDAFYLPISAFVNSLKVD